MTSNIDNTGPAGGSSYPYINTSASSSELWSIISESATAFKEWSSYFNGVESEEFWAKFMNEVVSKGNLNTVEDLVKEFLSLLENHLRSKVPQLMQQEMHKALSEGRPPDPSVWQKYQNVSFTDRHEQLIIEGIYNKYGELLDQQADGIGVKLTDTQKKDFFDQIFSGYLKKIASGEIEILNFEMLVNGFETYANTALSVDQETYDTALAILKSLFPDETTQNEMLPLLDKLFEKYLKEADGGIIDKGALLEEWTATIAKEYLGSIGLTIEDPILENKSLIITRVYALIRELVGELQLLTVAQSEKQLFLTKLDGAYTDLIASIPLTTKIPGADEDEETELKGDAQMLEQKWTENLRSLQEMVQSELKEAQTILSQSTESTNQAGNIIAQLIQQLQGLLSAIYR